MMGCNMEESIEILQEHFHFSADVHTIAQERREIMSELFKTKTKFIPGFKKSYNKIRKQYLTAVVTSLARQFVSVIETQLQLSTLFHKHSYSITDIGFISKPHPDIFLYAAKSLHINPKNCVVIEDSPDGVTGGKRSGMIVIGSTTSVQRDKLMEVDGTVDNFSEIMM